MHCVEIQMRAAVLRRRRGEILAMVKAIHCGSATVRQYAG